MTWLPLTIAALVLTCNLLPVLVLATLPVPASIKLRATGSLLKAAVLGLACFIPSLLAPLVVPLALLSMDEQDERLPRWAAWWGNDVSINGDQPEGAETYYAPGHDRRSFYARWVWLSLFPGADADLEQAYQMWGKLADSAISNPAFGLFAAPLQIEEV